MNERELLIYACIQSLNHFMSFTQFQAKPHKAIQLLVDAIERSAMLRTIISQQSHNGVNLWMSLRLKRKISNDGHQMTQINHLVIKISVIVNRKYLRYVYE